MNLNLNYEGFEKHLVKTVNRDIFEGIQYLFRFDNNYGASVVKHKYSYGSDKDLWELAVIKFIRDDTWYLNYDTDITDDVIGYLTDENVRDLLKKIKELQ